MSLAPQILGNFIILDFEGSLGKLPTEGAYLIVTDFKIQAATHSRFPTTTFSTPLLNYKKTHILIAHRHATEFAFLNQLHPYPSSQFSHHAFPPKSTWGPWLDTWLLSGQNLPINDLSLSSIIQHLNLTPQLNELASQYKLQPNSYHNALYDCLGCFLIYNHLYRKLGDYPLFKSIVN